MNQYTYQRSRTTQRTRTSGTDWKTLLLFYILPFVVVNGIIFYLVTAKPKYEVTVGETHDYMTTTMTFKIQSFLPTKNLSIAINGEQLELEKTGSKTYTASITQNGTIEISLENFNGMSTVSFEHVNILDDGLPAIASYEIEDGVLTLSLADSQSGVDFSSIHALDSDGVMVLPQSIDKLNGTVSLPMDPDGLTLFVSDMSGNTLEQPLHVNGTDGGDGLSEENSLSES